MKIKKLPQTLKERRKLFLDETIENFTKRIPRSVKKSNCLYYNKDTGFGCAIGIHIKDKELCNKLDKRHNSIVKHVFHELPKVLQDLGVEFLQTIQFLHDDPENWQTHYTNSPNKLSELGRKKIQYIIKNFDLK